MKIVVVFALVAGAFAEETNPLGKVVDLLNGLAAKVTADGEAEAKAFKEYFEWCDDASKNINFEIKTATDQKAKLEAEIAKLGSDIDASGTKIDELAASVSTSDADLKSATAIRDKEAADFRKGEAELVDTIDTLGRAIGILQREMQKNPAAFAQIDSTNTAAVVQALGAVVDAAAFASSDRQRLLALVQSQQGSENDDGDSDPGAPAAAVYKTHSSNIFDVLEDLKEKAETQLAELRKGETNTAHNYAMLKQSLEDQMAADTKDMNEEKAAKAAAEEGKAGAEGDLEVTNSDLKNAKTALATANSDCMETAANHEATVAARKDELKVIAEATKVLQDMTGGAVSQTYSFVQVGSSLRSHADLAKSEVIVMVKRLAQKHHSAALAQLASRISALVRYGGSNGDDAFGKVKGLIRDMIAKLEKEAGADATEKAYCDEQMAKTEAKKSELDEDIAHMTAKIDQAAARSAELKEQVKELQDELAALAKSQAEMDKIRQESHADFVQAKADLEQGLTGVRKALGVLRDYYASKASAAMIQDGTQFAALMQQPAKPELHGKASGAGQSIIGILEVVESDFATDLAKEEEEESTAASNYDKMTQENEVTKTTKEQDVKYKTQEFKSQDKTVAEYSADRDTANNELSAVLEYYAKIKERCIAKPETYEARKARREAEIAGLKEALSVLESETAFVQRKRRGHMRGAIRP